MSEPVVRETSIPGLLTVDLAVHADARGWFKENWQREKMLAAGLPDFGPVQHSVAHNGPVGVTRGIHAEPWDKFVSIVHGKVFGAWVDLREGSTFGTVHTEEFDEGMAVFVPRGVGNAYQTLAEDTVYSYLVNDHWSPAATYVMLNLADETSAISWPISLGDAVISDKDRAHPRLGEITPVRPRRTLVLGARGQLGRALLQAFPDAEGLGRDILDLSDPAAIATFDFSGVGTVINAAAYTAVDAAETVEGRRQAWAANATGVGSLARAALQHGFALIHYSSDYVFDGLQDAYDDDDPVAPLSVYGASKAAGDLAVSLVRRHYLIRTSWVVGEGSNFVATMAGLADRDVAPTVVADQIGRLTFTDDLARATAHLLRTRSPYGTYNVTSTGQPSSWADVARAVFRERAAEPGAVTDTNTEAYAAGKEAPVADRPARSVLRLDKIESSGFQPSEQSAALTTYLALSTATEARE